MQVLAFVKLVALACDSITRYTFLVPSQLFAGESLGRQTDRDVKYVDLFLTGLYIKELATFHRSCYHANSATNDSR